MVVTRGITFNVMQPVHRQGHAGATGAIGAHLILPDSEGSEGGQKGSGKGGWGASLEAVRSAQPAQMQQPYGWLFRLTSDPQNGMILMATRDGHKQCQDSAQSIVRGWLRAVCSGCKLVRGSPAALWTAASKIQLYLASKLGLCPTAQQCDCVGGDNQGLRTKI
jgi:hypothetical protein